VDSSRAAMAAAYAVAIGIVAVCFILYARLLIRLARGGGKVEADKFNFIDLAIGLAASGWLVSNIVHKFGHDDKPLHEPDIAAGAIGYVIIGGFLVAFLEMRNIRIWKMMGIERIGIRKASRRAIGGLLVAYPLIFCAAYLAQQALRNLGRPQQVIEFFVEKAKSSDRGTVVLVFLVAGILAPVVEELVFRGYLYPVFKRYFRMPVAIVLSSAIFAAIHLNVAALPPLFVLALCLAAAYEESGSLVVPIAMHAMFNVVSLSYLLIATLRP
jgi:CAAX protease family protein